MASSEEIYRALFTHIDEAFMVGELLYDEQGRPHDRLLLEVNPRYQEIISDRAVVGTTARQLFPDLEDEWFQRYHEVVTTGQAQRIENYTAPLGRWFDVYLSRVGGPGSRRFAAVFRETTERKQREANLALLSEVSRDLVGLSDPAHTLHTVGSRIVRHLKVSGCGFLEIDAAAQTAAVRFEWHQPGVPDIAGTHRLADFLPPDYLARLRAGLPVVCDDVRAGSAVNAAAFEALGIAAFVCMPIMEEGTWRFALCLHGPIAKAWRADEVELVGEVAARIWTRLDLAQAEEALRRSDEAHRALFAQMVGGVAEADLDGRYLNANRRYCELTGYTVEELRRLGKQDTTHPDDRARNQQRLEQLLESGEPFEIEKRYLRRDGSVVWVHNAVSVMRDAAGRPSGILSVSVDITARKQQEEQLRRSAELLHFLIDRSPTGFYIVDSDLRISHMNADSQARAFRNVNPAIGRRVDEALRVLWSEELAEEIFGRFRHTLETGEPFHSPGLVSDRADTGGVESYDWQLQRITMPDGRYAVVCYYYDTTWVREVERELREADRRKDEFLATLSHELRNPLAPLRNGLYLLRRVAPDSPQGQEVRAMMERQLSHLVRLVDDLMEVSRITRGKIELRVETLDLASVLDAACETSRPLIDANRHALLLQPWPEPLRVRADAVRLTQVFANLLNNAAHYTEAGGRIELAARRQGGHAVVSVRDNGMGIAPHMLARVFDLFTQADRSQPSAHGGLGIGLTLVRGLVQMHGGSIEASSGGEGQGSEFVVRLPLHDPGDGTTG